MHKLLNIKHDKTIYLDKCFPQNFREQQIINAKQIKIRQIRAALAPSPLLLQLQSPLLHAQSQQKQLHSLSPTQKEKINKIQKKREKEFKINILLK